MDQTVQTLNLGDFCNECGNCDTFCPTAGAPYRDKPRFWLDEEGYREAEGDAFHMSSPEGIVLLQARLDGQEHSLGCRAAWRPTAAPPCARFSAPGWDLLQFEARGACPREPKWTWAPAPPSWGSSSPRLNCRACEIFSPR